ncbi:hypothetical protein Dvina_51465 [Dactylosporangium vinaceum]|uniref:SAF domain-containing protein n=1 Tax=Dactylosporangium vinaceum TaxID=53362 RepID=A0ABV5M2I3_9ACTN|nr:SAF domain-containing protein [Dactylosporangium vinaceum]UAB96266.1 hypothetical protein Dvina_51465 [Dactylosporangium vinaceum]
MLRRRVSVPRVLLGVLLIVGCALAGAAVANRIDTRLPVLATARPVAAGQTITDADLTVVRVAAEAQVATVPAAQRGTVVGRTAAMPLQAGVLVSAQQLGDVAWPPAGQSVIAVGLKPGRAPAGLTAGTQVTVIVIPSTAPGGGGAAGGATGGSGTGSGPQVVRADATVVSVSEAADQSGVSVVSLLLSAADAVTVASTSGEAALVQRGVGR